MTTKILMKDQIKSWVLNVLSGHCFSERRPDRPRITILSPWIKDVQLEINKESRSWDEEWFSGVYGIGSINLPYALLTLKLDFGAEIDIVTLPPTEKHHHEKASSVRVLLDFLDEIGCNMYINSDLHSKLILSNDMALLGSFNLSFPALWGREEVGVCIDDMENLRILENYATEVIASSKPYGYTLQATEQESTRGDRIAEEQVKMVDRHGHIGRDEIQSIEERFWKPINSVTRGWLFERILHYLEDVYEGGRHDKGISHEFLFSHLRPSGALSYNMIKLAASDLEAFYINILLAFRKSEPEKILGVLDILFSYKGTNEVGEILDFLATKFARTHVPKIRPMIMPFPNKNE